MGEGTPCLIMVKPIGTGAVPKEVDRLRNVVDSASMSKSLPACPECHEAFTYEQGALLVCPMYGHEWSKDSTETTSEAALIKDAAGNVLADGDTVAIVKDLKVKGAGGGVVKVGMKVRGIRLIKDGMGDHDIDAPVPGFGRMHLKSSVVKKVL
ncbi:zinc ribbon domain-containing protein YjdM [Arthrobacter sp. GCM10027362]|uniref:zinc ribbon domain-containing protein YjdM n=1 Tax=Arthrobacter sp. GCM10027362 TaxID=3273379 RepID=UPI0036353503